MNAWKQTVAAAIQTPAPVVDRPVLVPSYADLMAAGRVFAARCSNRNDTFAARSSEAAFDIAGKIESFGSYASQAQQGYAAKLVAWAGLDKPAAPQQFSDPTRPVEAPVRPVAPTLPVPALSALIAPDRFAKLTVGSLSFRLNNDPADHIWVKDGDFLIGVIDRPTATFKTVKSGSSRRDELFTAVAAIEVDPRQALEDHGQLTGRCGCCGRLLTDAASVARGIGPICLERGGFL